MAIENLELSNQHDQNKNMPAVITADTALKANQIFIAGMQKIRHPLLDCEMMLYGFIGEVSSNVIFEEFVVEGLKIRFKKRDSEAYESITIFQRILIDLKENLFYDLFPELETIKYSYGVYTWGYKIRGDKELRNKRNFYFFKNNFDSTPEVFSDEVYMVCKYREEGKFKYGLFSTHELTFVY